MILLPFEFKFSLLVVTISYSHHPFSTTNNYSFSASLIVTEALADIKGARWAKCSQLPSNR